MRKIEPYYYIHKINGEIDERMIEESEKKHQRIKNEIEKLDTIDLEIIINTDIPFRIYYYKTWRKYQSFNDFLKGDKGRQKEIYLMFLRDVLFFPNLVFQKN